MTDLQPIPHPEPAQPSPQEQALRRIDEGVYGRCASCGTEIGAARLQALPDASLCIDCASTT